MSLFFLIPLATFFVAAYVFKHSADEMSYLAAVMAIISLLLTLVFAPWPIQLLLLAVVVFSNRKKTLSSNLLVNPEVQKEEAIRLLYRGANYEAHSETIEVSEDEITGKYRGQIWVAHDMAKAPMPLSPTTIKYRGVSLVSQPPHH